MSDTKISALTALTGGSVDTSADVFAIVDTSAGATKKILVDDVRISLSATQALQEAGTNTSTFVMPSVQQFHPSASKAWCKFDGTLVGANAPTVGYNVSSVTRNSAGNYSIFYTTPFSSANYAALVQGNSNNVDKWGVPSSATVSTLVVTILSGTQTDSNPVSFVAFGDQ